MEYNQKKSPKVSIFLTSYNHGKYLRDSIDSALSQTFTDFELFILDDASTDDSWKIINSYSDSRIIAYKNEQNRHGDFPGLFPQASTGEYIAIHHSDDLWETDKLEKQVAFLDKHPEICAVFSNALLIGEEGEIYNDKSNIYYNIFNQPNRNRHEWLNLFFFHGNALCHPSLLIRKIAFEHCGIYRYGLFQLADFDMWVRLCFDYEIFVMPEKLVRFRIRDNQANASGDYPENQIRLQFEYLQILYNYLRISNYDEMEKIFPVVKNYQQEYFDAAYLLAIIALEVKQSKPHELFGLQLLFETLSNPVKAEKINKFYQFDFQKFKELTGDRDIFSVILNKRIDGIRKEHEVSLCELRAVREELHNVYASASWKITKPLRTIKNHIHSIKKN